jgi:hypothetical protein
MPVNLTFQADDRPCDRSGKDAGKEEEFQGRFHARTVGPFRSGQPSGVPDIVTVALLRM